MFHLLLQGAHPSTTGGSWYHEVMPSSPLVGLLSQLERVIRDVYVGVCWTTACLQLGCRYLLHVRLISILYVTWCTPLSQSAGVESAEFCEIRRTRGAWYRQSIRNVHQRVHLQATLTSSASQPPRFLLRAGSCLWRSYHDDMKFQGQPVVASDCGHLQGAGQ